MNNAIKALVLMTGVTIFIIGIASSQLADISEKKQILTEEAEKNYEIMLVQCSGMITEDTARACSESIEIVRDICENVESYICNDPRLEDLEVRISSLFF